MANPENEQSEATAPTVPSSWGPWLFKFLLAAGLVYFWWLTVYSHGIGPESL